MRILTISLNAWNDTMATGNTFSNFFADVQHSDELANVYCREEPVFNSLCKKYFKVTEKDIIKSIISFSASSCGSSYVKDFSQYIKNSPGSSSRNKVKNTLMRFLREHRLGSLLFLREAIWATHVWKNEKLRAFLLDFKPDVIYMHGHNNMYMHKLLWYCQQITNAKVVVYWGDDMYNYKGERFIKRLYHTKLRRQLKYTVDHADMCLGGSPLLCVEYSSIFGRPFELQIKTCKMGEPRSLPFKREPVSMVYAGNLLYGRDKMLMSLARIIKQINKENKHFVLHIYTGSEISNSTYDALHDGHNVIMEGTRPYNEICSILDDAGIAVFVESFETKYKRQTRLSFSTKIIDYFQAKSTLMAYGPSDVSSIDYLIGSNTGFVATSEEDLENILNVIMNDPASLDRMYQTKREYAIKNHTMPMLLSRLRAVCN